MTLIHELSVVQLSSAYRRRELSPVEVVRSYLLRIERHNPGLNAVVWTRRRLALSEARAAEQRFVQGGELPPLLGVPFTAKECISVAGAPLTGGSVFRRHVVASQDAIATARLRAAGAICLGVTNESELGLWIESDNPLYGRVENPHRAGHTAGGSSGGEGCATAAALSAFGLGSDIGGSIRLPAAFCGAFGHKPSAGRVPVEGSFPPVDGAGRLLLGLGPLCRHAEDLYPLLSVLSGQDPADRSTVSLPLPPPDLGGLRGRRVYVWQPEDHWVSAASPEVQAALARAQAALEAHGCVAEPWTPADRAWCTPFWLGIMAHSTGADLWDLATAGERSLASEWFQLIRRDASVTFPVLLMGSAARLRAPEILVARWVSQAAKVRQRVHDRLADGSLLLTPPFPTSAPQHGTTFRRPLDWSYAGMLNVLHLPATSVPAGRDALGLPLAVQVAAGPGQDSLTLCAAQALEQPLGGWVRPAMA